MTAKLYTAAALLTVASFISCSGNQDKEVVDKSVIPTGSETTTAQPAVTSANTATTTNANMLPAPNTGLPSTVVPGATSGTVSFKPQPVNANPQNIVTTTVPQTTTVTPATSTVTAPGMNPPHGQPGHRCDIQVGAPLNSKPAPVNVQPGVTTAQTQPSNVTMKEIPNTVKTAPGMNPPHGEPGHRCDIAVGAPLNSKPAAPAANPAPTNNPPALLTAPKNDTIKK